MAYFGTPTSAEFSAGVSHPVNPGRANVGSITLGGGLQAASARWNGLVPHSVHPSALSAGTGAETDMSAELGQKAAGNAADAPLAGHDMQRALVRQAGRLGADDNLP